MAEEGIDWATWNGYDECPHSDGHWKYGISDRMLNQNQNRGLDTKHHPWWRATTLPRLVLLPHVPGASSRGKPGDTRYPASKTKKGRQIMANAFGSVGTTGQLIAACYAEMIENFHTSTMDIQRALTELDEVMGMPEGLSSSSCCKYDITVTRKHVSNKITYTINVTPHGTTTKSTVHKVSSELGADVKALLNSIITH